MRLPASICNNACVNALAGWRRAGQELGDELPENEYQDAFAPDYRLHPPVRAEVENLNTREYLQQLLSKLMSNLSRCGAMVHPAVLRIEHAWLLMLYSWLVQFLSSARYNVIQQRSWQ